MLIRYTAGNGSLMQLKNPKAFYGSVSSLLLLKNMYLHYKLITPCCFLFPQHWREEGMP